MKKNKKTKEGLNKDISSDRRNTFLIYLSIFAVAFLFMFSLTYNFNFFWEDKDQISLYLKISKENPSDYTFHGMAKNFLSALFPEKQFESTQYSWKPMSEFIISAMSNIFRWNIMDYRIFRSVLFAILMMLCFYIFSGLAGKNKKSGDNGIKSSKFAFSGYFMWLLKDYGHLLPILMVLNLLVLPEMWLTILYAHDDLIFTMIFMVAALLLFFFIYRRIPEDKKARTFLIFMLILLFTQLSITTKHIGRMNFAIILAFMLLRDRKKLLTLKYFGLILALFIISVPLIGITRTIYTPDTILNVTGISKQMTTNNVAGENKGLSFGILSFIKTFHLSFLPHSAILLAAFFIFLIIHLYAIFKLGNQKIKDNETENSLDLFVFSLLWCLSSTFIFFLARGLKFDPGFFLRFEFSIFIIPQTLMLVSYYQFVYKGYFNKKKIFQYIICLVLLISILLGLVRLNEWRGGWGAYFLGYDTARQYVDGHASNSVMLLPFDHSSPTYFVSTNNEMLVKDITNSSLFREYQHNYTTVFIASKTHLTFENGSMFNVTQLRVIDNSLYGKFKRFIGRDYKDPIYLYTLQK